MKKTASLKFAGLALLGSFALAACNQANLTGSAKTYAFAAQAGFTDGQAGTATRADLNSKDTTTVLSATKLKPSTLYVAHYHLAGTDTTQGVCASKGKIIDGNIGNASVLSDANGNLVIRGLTATTNLANAMYINIHEDRTPDLSSVPLCADLTLPPTK